MSASRPSMRSFVLLAVGALSAGMLTLGSAGAAHAQTALLQCQGTETDAYTPGVTFQPHEFNVTLTGQYSSCVDTTGQVTSGSYGPERFSLDADCDNLLEGF